MTQEVLGLDDGNSGQCRTFGLRKNDTEQMQTFIGGYRRMGQAPLFL